MLKLAADENFDNRILRGLLRRQPDLDIVRIQDTEVNGANDDAVLTWVAQNGRVLLTHDTRTMAYFAYERIRRGQAVSGVLEVSAALPIGQVIEDLLLLVNCTTGEEWQNQVRYLPV